MNRTLVFTYGRFNPPTRGHAQLFNVMQFYRDFEIRHGNMAMCVTGVSRTHDKKKNPLDPQSKLKWLNLFFKQTNFILATPEMPSFVQMLQNYSRFYDKLIFICGSDRMDEYKNIVHKYNDKLFKFDKIEFVSAGNRINIAEGVEGVSGTRMRQYVKDNDFQSWISNCPHKDISPDMYLELWNELRETLK